MERKLVNSMRKRRKGEENSITAYTVTDGAYKSLRNGLILFYLLCKRPSCGYSAEMKWAKLLRKKKKSF